MLALGASLAFFTLLAGSALAQHTLQGPDQKARVQVIHNAADTSLGVVDVYVNGSLAYDDLGFREATPYFDVPAGVQATLALAPGTSTSAREAVTQHTLSADDGDTFLVIADGVLAPEAFAPNPDGRATALTLRIKKGLPESLANQGLLRVVVAHGVTDAPTLDLRLRELAQRARLFRPAALGDITTPRALPTRSFTLDVVPVGARKALASFEMDLSGLGGHTAAVIASGFVDPAANHNGAAFAVLVVLPDGTVMTLPREGATPTTARVQIIQNSADPNLGFVDVYADRTLVADDLGFRAATPFFDLPGGVPLKIGIAPFKSADANSVLHSFSVMLEPATAYVFILGGVLGADDFAPNPDGRETALTLFVKENAREASTHRNQIQLFAHHGVTDAPGLRVETRGGAPVLTDARYGDLTDYTAVPAGIYTLTATAADSLLTTPFTLNLSTLAGVAAVVLASGFRDPDANKQGLGFGLVMVLPDGTVMELPAAPSTRPLAQDGLMLRGVYPNPFNPTTTIGFDLPAPAHVGVEVFDMLGRRVLHVPARRMPAGRAQHIPVDGSALASGLYLYRLTARAEDRLQVYTGRLTVLK